MDTKFNNKKFGKLVDESGKSQTWFAKQLKVDKNTIYRYRSGCSRPKYPTIKVLAELLGVSEKDLLIE